MSLLLARRRPLLFPSAAAADGYAAEVAADSPFAWWRFEETSGATAADEVGSNDGTVTGANLNVTGAVGSGISYDGVDDRTSVGTLSGMSFGGASPFTIELLFKTTSATAPNMLFGSTRTTGANTILQCYSFDDSGTLRLRVDFRNSAGSETADQKDRFTASSAAALADGNWHHFAVVYTDTSTPLMLYVDGVDDSGATPRDNSPISGTLAEPMMFGARNLNGSAATFWPGQQDEAAIYDKVLTPARILAHAQAAGLA